MNTNFGNPILAEDVLFEILILLPVKSLCRFRCVSKTWSSIISDSKFVAAHLARSMSRPKLLISLKRDLTDYCFIHDDEIKFYSVEYPQEEEEVDEPTTPVLHATAHNGSINSPYAKMISASKGGLICCFCQQGITIGNPITGDFDLIQYSSSHNQNHVISSYLGFDPVDNKQVILTLEDNYPSLLAKTSVLSLLERQWHNITLSPQISITANKSAISMNGVIYFIAQAYPFDWKNSITRYGECLCAFDVRLEDFKIIQRPPDPVFEAELVIEYKDRVALVGPEYCWYNHPHSYEMKLWILEDSETYNWRSIKSFVVPWKTTSPFVELFGATPRGELMFASGLSTQGCFDLFLYEIDTNTLRRFQVDIGLVPTSLYAEIRLDFLIESLYSPIKKKQEQPTHHFIV